MDKLSIDTIKIKDNRLEIIFKISGRWKQYISDTNFYCEYNKSIKNLPESLAVVPLLGNILPIAWVYHLKIKIKRMDEDFYNNLSEVMDGYINMYPSITFYDCLEVGELEKNGDGHSYKTACFFSGGVDAYYTFLRHRKENPVLVTVWGSDVALDDYKGWKKVNNAVKEAGLTYGAENCIIKSNFREIVNANALTAGLQHPGWSWWHEFQHGIGLITLMAPLSYADKIGRLYIASSYTADVKNLTCASDPSIDNHVRFNGCEVIHDGFDTNRQGKVRYIVEFAKQNKTSVDLRVCWVSRGGKNCCICEKCCRTMMAIYLEDGLLADFGFHGENTTLIKIARNMKYKNSALSRDWDVLHDRFLEKYTLSTVPKEWKWFYRGGTDSINNNLVFLIVKFSKKVIFRLKKIKRKGISA